MDKRHNENIQDFIDTKLQKAENQADNNSLDLALETLREVETDIRIAGQLGLLPDSYQREVEIVEGIYDKIDRLRKLDERRVI